MGYEGRVWGMTAGTIGGPPEKDGVHEPAKIAIRGLKKQFDVGGRQVDALSGIDLDIRPGEFFCIVGPSGCGKTTMLRILAELETPSEGTIDIWRNGGDVN